MYPTECLGFEAKSAAAKEGKQLKAALNQLPARKKIRKKSESQILVKWML